MTRPVFPKNGGSVDTHTDVQNECIRRISEEGTDKALNWMLPVKNGTELSRPRSVVLEWSTDLLPPYNIELSEEENMRSPLTRYTDAPRLELTNLKVGQKYFWRINGGEVWSFSTEDNKYRFMDIDGALNVRDIGGVNIKQGLIYRGSEIDKEFKLSDKGKYTFKNELAI